MKRHAWWPMLALLLVAVIWGGGFIASQIALDEGFRPPLIMATRFTVASLAMAILGRKRLRAHLKWEHWKGGAAIASLLFLAFYVQIVALQYTTPSNNAFLTAANVVMVPFLWWAATRRVPPVKAFVASFLCLVGIGLLTLEPGMATSFSPGDLLTLLCALLFAAQIVATGLLAPRIETEVLVFLQLFLSAVFSLLVFVVTGPDLSPFASLRGTAAVLYLGLFSTCLCYLLQTWSQRVVESSKAAILLSLESLFGAVFSVALGYDPLTWTMVAGGGVIFASVLLSEWKLKSS